MGTFDTRLAVSVAYSCAGFYASFSEKAKDDAAAKRKFARAADADGHPGVADAYRQIAEIADSFAENYAWMAATAESIASYYEELE